MYLDKPLRDHNLLQAICRTNRPYSYKTHGLIVDYLGVFDDVARALQFDEKSVQQAVKTIEAVKAQVPIAMKKCLAFFPGVDRSNFTFEGLIAAQNCLPNNEKRDAFAAEYSVMGRLWEGLSPDACLESYKLDYRWLSQVYESVKPPSGHGKLLWHSLGAKTLELINQNIHVNAVRELDKLVLDSDMIEGLAAVNDPQKIKTIEIQLAARLRKHEGNPRFIALGQRLEELKDKHEQGLIASVEFLKALLTIAREVLEAEKDVNPEEEQDRAKAALTELFNEVKTDSTPVIVERLVDEIDSIVRIVRFDGWQQTSAGEREVQKALRASLLKYKLHKDQELFDRAYAYIKQYY